jgi:hypothetical protein
VIDERLPHRYKQSMATTKISAGHVPLPRILTRWRRFREVIGGLWFQTDSHGWQLVALPDYLAPFPADVARVLRERWTRTAAYVGLDQAGAYQTTRTDHGAKLRDTVGDVIGAALLADVLRALVQPYEALPLSLQEQLDEARAALERSS